MTTQVDNCNKEAQWAIERRDNNGNMGSWSCTFPSGSNTLYNDVLDQNRVCKGQSFVLSDYHAKNAQLDNTLKGQF